MTARKKVSRSKASSKKKTVSKKASVSRPKTKKVAKKITASRPKTKKKMTAPKAKPNAKAIKSTKIKVKTKVSKPKPKLKPDTLLSCHKCGKNEKVNFEYMWSNGWVRCCNEAMHLEDSSIKIGDVMNKAWINNGGYSGNFSVAKA